MEELAFLPVGLLVGMAHALEADHMAAVATMMEREGNRKRLILRGAFWGVGHTISLFAICSVVLLFGLSISERLESSFEMAVGFMILGLGLHLLWKISRRGVHAHVHSHGDGRTHLHFHQHDTTGGDLEKRMREHGHAGNFAGMMKPLAIGLLHGAAGSAGLLVLILAATKNLWQSYAYAALFGIGAMIGMALLSAVVSLPLVALNRRGGNWVQRTTSLAIAAVAIYVGVSLAADSFAHLRTL